MFWGVLFLFFDYYVSGIDVVPDIVGFIFIYVGLRGLALYDVEYHSRFGKATQHASMGIVLASMQQVFRFVVAQETLWKDKQTVVRVFNVLFAVVVTAALVLTVYLLGRSLGILCREANKDFIAKNCEVMTMVYVFVGGITAVLSQMPELGRLCTDAMFAGLAVTICYLLMLRRVQTELQSLYM